MDAQDYKKTGFAYSEFKIRKPSCPKSGKCRGLMMYPANENMLTTDKKGQTPHSRQK